MKKPDPDIVDLLARLGSSQAGEAWAAFIEGYAPCLMAIVKRFDHDPGGETDCFLYLCEKLYENDFRRLRRFRVSGKASFRTWLGAVAFKLCVDWHRREYGRVQMVAAVAALPALDRATYRLIFEQELNCRETLETLRADYPDLTRGQLSEAIARVHSVLTPRQRWRLSVVARRRFTDCVYDPKLPGAVPDPQQEFTRQQEAEAVREAVSWLPRDQRVLLMLRFNQGLTLKKIAAWLRDHIKSRPHRALNNLAPLEYMAQLESDFVRPVQLDGIACF